MVIGGYTHRFGALPVELKPAEGWLLLPDDSLFIRASMLPVSLHAQDFIWCVCVCVFSGLEIIKIRASWFGGGGARG